ncbi:retrovirus-related pol polyprotein from transposon TNT 1-94 [Tanacetum coccineum]
MNPSLFIYSRGDTLLYILVYVDDIIVTCNNKGTIDNIICQLGSAFALKDLGPLNYFLGIEIVRMCPAFFYLKRSTILELLQSTGLSNCNPVSSPMVTSSSLSLDDSTAFFNPVKYRQVVGSLQYVTLSRSDIAFVVNKVCQYMHDPTENHWSAVKRILRYLHGTVEHGMLIRRSSGSTLQAFTDVLWKGNPDTSLEAFSYADWARDSDDRRSMGGFAIYLGSNLIYWTARKQPAGRGGDQIVPLQKLNTRLLLTLLLSSHGFKLFLMSLESVHLQLLYCGVTILVQHTCQLTLSFMRVQNTWK